MDEGGDDIDAPGMIVIHFLGHIAPKLKQAGAMIPVYHARAENLGGGAGGLGPPDFKLKQAIPRRTITLREKQVVLGFGVDMGNAPLVFQYFNSLIQALEADCCGSLSEHGRGKNAEQGHGSCCAGKSGESVSWHGITSWFGA